MPLLVSNLSKSRSDNLGRGFCCVIFLFSFLFFSFLSEPVFAILPTCTSSTLDDGITRYFYKDLGQNFDLMPDVGNNCGDIYTLKSCSDSSIKETTLGTYGEALYKGDMIIEEVSCRFDELNKTSCETIIGTLIAIGSIPIPNGSGSNCVGYLPYCEDLKSIFGINKVKEGENCNALPYCHKLPFWEDPIPKGTGRNCELKSCIHLSGGKGGELYQVNAFYDRDSLYSDCKDKCENEDNRDECADDENDDDTTCSDASAQESIYINRIENSLKYKYCEPYIYKIVGKIFKKTAEKLRCNFVKRNQLKYIRSRDEDTDTVETKKQCFLHYCPFSGTDSITCKTDVETTTLNEGATEDSPDVVQHQYRLKWREGVYDVKYREEILGSVNNEVQDFCTYNQCDLFRTREPTKCEGSDGNILASDCDVCVGVDINAPDHDDCAKYNTVPHTCTSGVCYKTIDCAFPVSEDTDFCTLTPAAIPSTGSFTSIDSDAYTSWFYRPTPINTDYSSFDTGGMCMSKTQYFAKYDDCAPYTFNIGSLWGGNVKKYLAKCSNAGCILASIGTLGCFGEYQFWDPKLSSPHICGETKHNGGSRRSIGRSGICKNKALWHQPNMDIAAYTYGDLIVDYMDGDGNPIEYPSGATYGLKVGVRYHNTLELESCGERECRVDCIYGKCRLQYCGYDAHSTLRTNKNMQCSLGTMGEINVDDLDPYDPLRGFAGPDGKIIINNRPDPKCAGNPGGSRGQEKLVRVRAEVYGDKICAFLDMKSDGAQNYNLYDNPRRNSGPGHLDRYSLLDDNSRESTNCPNGIAECSRKKDDEVFGENLLKSEEEGGLGCPTDYDDFKDNMDNDGEGILKAKEEELKDETEDKRKKEIKKLKLKLEKCRELAINIGNDGSGTDWSRWHSIDVIQYIGNNQPEGSPRGYYDHNGVFYPEQQCMKMPLAMGPPKFYKYATGGGNGNTEKLFAPVMYIDRVIRSCDSISDKNECEGAVTGNIENTSASFIDPGIKVKFGNRAQMPVVPFGNLKEPIDMGQYKYRKINSNVVINQGEDLEAIYSGDTALYFVEKVYLGGASLERAYREGGSSDGIGDGDMAKICLKKLSYNIDGYVDNTVGCISRRKPGRNNIIVMPGKNSDYNSGRLQAILVRNAVTDNLCDMDNGDIPADYENKCIELDKEDPADQKEGEERGGKVNGVDYVEVGSEESDEDLNYIGISGFGLGDGYLLGVGYGKLTDGKEGVCSQLFNECITNRINLFNEKSKVVENTVKLDLYQDFEDKCQGTIATQCNLLKDTKNSYGYYHEACVNKGFGHILDEVISYVTTEDGVKGKCVLDDNSKETKACRLEIPNEERTLNICECKDDPDATSTIDCKKLPSECYSGGYNGNGISYTNKVGGLKDDEYIKSRVCRCARTGGVTKCKSTYCFNTQLGSGVDSEENSLKARQETEREAGLCVDIPIKASCEAVSYGKNDDSLSEDYADEEGNYRELFWENDAGKPVSEIHESHIRRTRHIQEIYLIDIPKISNDNDIFKTPFGHADMPLSVEEMLDPRLGEFDDQGNVVDPGGVPGECKGFWTENEEFKKAERIPNAECTTIPGNMHGKGEYTDFENSCERYKCQELKSKERENDKKYNPNYLGDTTYQDKEMEGQIHGYAEWPEFNPNKIDTYDEKGRANKDDIVLNTPPDGDKDGDGYPDIDDIHLVKASRCIDGYGPRGANYRLEEYMGNMIGTGFDDVKRFENVWYDIETSITNGYLAYLEKTKTELDVAANKLLGYGFNGDPGLGISFGSEPSNLANERLPKRYCNQVGEWEDTLSKNGIGTLNADGIMTLDNYNNVLDPYYVNYKCLNGTNFTEGKCADIGENGYNEAQLRFCERLYCPAKGVDDIENNMNVDSARHFWKRTGGATWEETKASRFKAKLNDPVYGVCDLGRNYYPRNTEFLGDVGDQQKKLQCSANIEVGETEPDLYVNSCESEEFDLYNIFISDSENGTQTTYFSESSGEYYSNPESGLPDLVKELIVNKRNGVSTEFDYPDLLVVDGSEQSQPSRYCNHLGLWGQVILPCVKSCHYIGKGKIVEKEIDGVQKSVGDDYTGGARWRKVLSTDSESKGGEMLNRYKDYECQDRNPTGYDVRYDPPDSTGADKNKYKPSNDTYCSNIEFNSRTIDGYTDNGVGAIYAVRGQCDPMNHDPLQGFVQSASGNPARVCKADGTWGKIIRPCLLSRPCLIKDAFTTGWYNYGPGEPQDGESGHGYANWDTGNSIEVFEIKDEDTVLGVNLTVEEECLSGFWVDVDGDQKQDTFEDYVKLIRTCNTTKIGSDNAGTWMPITGDNYDGLCDGKPCVEQMQCTIMTCNEDSLKDNIYEPVAGEYYVWEIYKKYGDPGESPYENSLSVVDDLAIYSGYQVKNDDTIDCDLDTDPGYRNESSEGTNYHDCKKRNGKYACIARNDDDRDSDSDYGDCVKNRTNYKTGVGAGVGDGDEPGKINSKKLCILGFRSDSNLTMTCNKKSKNGYFYGKWNPISGSCVRNFCPAFKDVQGIYWNNIRDEGNSVGSYLASYDKNGNGVVAGADEIITVEGVCPSKEAGHPKRECLPDGTWGPVFYDAPVDGDDNRCKAACFKDSFVLDSTTTPPTEVIGINDSGVRANFDAIMDFNLSTGLGWRKDAEDREFMYYDGSTTIPGECVASDGYGNNYKEDLKSKYVKCDSCVSVLIIPSVCATPDGIVIYDNGCGGSGWTATCCGSYSDVIVNGDVSYIRTTDNPYVICGNNGNWSPYRACDPWRECIPQGISEKIIRQSKKGQTAEIYFSRLISTMSSGQSVSFKACAGSDDSGSKGKTCEQRHRTATLSCNDGSLSTALSIIIIDENTSLWACKGPPYADDDGRNDGCYDDHGVTAVGARQCFYEKDDDETVYCTGNLPDNSTPEKIVDIRFKLYFDD